MNLSPSARNLPIGHAGVNASVVIKSPSKVLGSAALDAWENDFTRLQHEGSIISPPDIVSYLRYSECDEDTMTFKQEKEPSNAATCDKLHDTQTIVATKDNDGDDTFCFQCFNHDCNCLVECCIDSADTSTHTDNARFLETLSNTSDTENESSFSGDQTPSPTCLPDHSNGFSLSQHSSEENGLTTYDVPSQSFSGLRGTSILQNELRRSSEYKNGISTHQKAEENSIFIAKRPAPKEYAIKHQSLNNSASLVVMIVPSNETILNLLPRLALDNDLNDIQFNSTAVTWNSPRGPDDLYSPRWQRGIGPKKEGLCPLCDPTSDVSISIRNMWLKTKTSRFWYHMNFYHGISASNGRPYSPPVRLRAIDREHTSNTGKHVIVHQGYCGQCGQWVDLQARQPLMVPELKWWKHTQKCHVLGERYQISDVKCLATPSISVLLPPMLQ